MPDAAELKPIWNSSAEQWVVRIEHAIFGPLGLGIETQGRHDEPSDAQLTAIVDFLHFRNDIIDHLPMAVKAYADDWQGLESFDFLKEEDFNIDLIRSGGVVPATYDNGRTYVIVHGRSDVDMEHGLACVFFGRREFGITSADNCMSPPASEDYAELEHALAGRGSN